MGLAILAPVWRSIAEIKQRLSKLEGQLRTETPRDDHRGWQIEHNSPPIPCRDFDWTATHPDFDGPEDGRQVWGRTINDVVAAINGWYEDQDNG